MNSLKEYYDNDFPTTLKLNTTQSINIGGEIIATLHMDFTTNSKFVSYYVSSNELDLTVFKKFLLDTNAVINSLNNYSIHGGLFFEPQRNAEQLIFTKVLYIYSNTFFNELEKKSYIVDGQEKGLIIIIRDKFYMDKRNELEKPRAFISHDSRDKKELVRPLCERLRTLLCTVWYDEFSLRVGDDLRESIEQGIKKCNKCIIVLSPDFLSNTGWTRKEFESIYQKEVMEGRTSILPIWHNVKKNQVYEYCSSLTNVFALNSSEGIEPLADKIYNVLMNPRQ